MDSIDEAEEQETYIDEEAHEIVQYIPDPDTTCTICHAEFLDPEDLNIHLSQVHRIASSVLRKCDFCADGYTDLMDYAEHIRDTHISSLKWCTTCWRVFNDFDAHRTHFRKHITKSGSIYSCSQCKQKYDDDILLKQHEYECHSESEGVMLHGVIPYLSAALKVKAITFLEAFNTDVVYICVGCNFSTVDIRAYLRHVKSSHCQIYVCHKCGNVFKLKRNLARHVNIGCSIFGLKNRQTRHCPDCNTFVDVRRFKKHKLHCKPIKCYTCDITFTSMNDWSEHASKEHSGISVEVEACQFCWKRCVGKVAMQKHIEKTHKPELHLYKYLCIYCNSVFKHPQKLFGHFVTKHKEIYPYTCLICDKTFRFRKKFTIHIKMVHKSVGFVEFGKNYHVFFTDKKSEKPFIPKSIYVHESQKFNQQENDQNEADNSGNAGINSDFMNMTETEGNQTETNQEIQKEKPKLKRKRPTNVRKEDSESVQHASSDEDEPLLVVRKRVRLQKKRVTNAVSRRRHFNGPNKALLTCNICKKYCYTFQNYNHHVSLHSTREGKKCIKCSKVFKSRAKLNEHVAIAHSSSKLTETLKTMLQKRKAGSSMLEDMPSSVRFRRTIKKVKADPVETDSCAKITEVGHKLSVQKFFENFVPEENTRTDVICPTATIKIVSGRAREPSIKMTKFQPKPVPLTQRLAMPVKYADNYSDQTKISIKLVQPPKTSNLNVKFVGQTNNTDTKFDYYSDVYDDGDRHETIPEVAEEVLLEGTEETPKAPKKEGHKLVIPKLPSELTDIRIAHLLPQAPYFKIVKVKDVLVQNEEEKEESSLVNAIKLADGTKLVTANPLAHLLGKEQEKVLNSVRNKYYKPKTKNLQFMLAKALTQLDNPTRARKRKMKSEP